MLAYRDRASDGVAVVVRLVLAVHTHEVHGQRPVLGHLPRLPFADEALHGRRRAVTTLHFVRKLLPPQLRNGFLEVLCQGQRRVAVAPPPAHGVHVKPGTHTPTQRKDDDDDNVTWSLYTLHSPPPFARALRLSEQNPRQFCMTSPIVHLDLDDVVPQRDLVVELLLHPLQERRLVHVDLLAGEVLDGDPIRDLTASSTRPPTCDERSSSSRSVIDKASASDSDSH